MGSDLNSNTPFNSKMINAWFSYHPHLFFYYYFHLFLPLQPSVQLPVWPADEYNIMHTHKQTVRTESDTVTKIRI